MKFISNIGWMSKNSQSLNVEIFNEQYLFNIPLSEISNLLNAKKPQILFYIPLKKTYGICTLSNSGKMVFFDIDEKKFGTPTSLLDDVISKGLQKPLSEIDDRPEFHLTSYSIYDSILSGLFPSPPNDIPQELKKYEKSTVDLIKKYHGINVGQLDYDDPNLQAAYMLCYFPSYIENIYHLLKHECCQNIQCIFKNNMKTSFYGCGPSPDLLGYLAFLNQNYRSEITNIDVNFFDMHDWGYWRELCVKKFSKTFADNLDITHHPNEVDLIECKNSTYFSSKKVDGTNLHIFQNCTTDIYTQCKSFSTVSSIFNNIFEQIDPGSVVLLNDFLGKGDSMKIIYAIKKKVEDNHELELLNKKYNVNEYAPSFTQNSDVRSFLSRCYQTVGIRPRNNNTGYSYLLVQRKE